MSKIVVYTAIFGGIKDVLRPPIDWPEDDPDVRLVCFTDREKYQDAEHWEVLPAVFKQPNPRRTARQHKCLSHVLFPEADWVLWVDGCLRIKINPREIVEEHQKEKLVTFKHMERTCLYQELQACIRLRKDNEKIMRNQVDKYRQRGYPPYNGLGETTAVLRRHCSAIEKFNEAWWNEIDNNSLRDQLSFDYVAYKLKIPYGHFDGWRIKSKNFDYRPHR
jgi:hypothetical protein